MILRTYVLTGERAYRLVSKRTTQWCFEGNTTGWCGGDYALGGGRWWATLDGWVGWTFELRPLEKEPVIRRARERAFQAEGTASARALRQE